MAKFTSGKGPGRAGRPAADPGPGRAARDRYRRLRKAAPDAVAAERELRRHAAEWLAAVRSRIVALAAEVGDVCHAARPGTVLARVLDTARLSAVAVALDAADCESAPLRVTGYEMPIPNLLAARDYVCRELFPLAAEGAELLADDTGPNGGAP